MDRAVDVDRAADGDGTADGDGAADVVAAGLGPLLVGGAGVTTRYTGIDRVAE